MIAKWVTPFQRRQIDEYLDEFYQLQTIAPGPIPSSICLDLGNSDPHLCFSFLVHGDEVGSLPAVNYFVQKALRNKVQYKGKLSFILGNPEAALKGRRFIDEDLNRVFHSNDTWKPLNYERKRAIEIQSLLRSCDWLLDIHQTRQASLSSFFIFPFELETYFWARALGGSKFLITQKPGSYFSENYISIDEYARDLGKTALCLELGQKGLSSDSFYLCFNRLLQACKLAQLSQTQFLEIVVRSPELKFIRIKDQIQFQHPNDRLNSGIYNFKTIRGSSRIGIRANGEPIVCPRTSYALFPKYFDGTERKIWEATLRSSPLVMLGEGFTNHPIHHYASDLQPKTQGFPRQTKAF